MNKTCLYYSCQKEKAHGLDFCKLHGTKSSQADKHYTETWEKPILKDIGYKLSKGYDPPIKTEELIKDIRFLYGLVTKYISGA